MIYRQPRFILCIALLIAAGHSSIFSNASAAEVTASGTNAVSASANPVLQELSAAAAYLKGLKRLGDLPGVSSNSSTEISSGRLPVSMLEGVKYPFEATLLVKPAAESSTYHYTVVRPEAGAAWQLEKAWQSNSRGQKVKEWPVNSVPKLHSAAASNDLPNLVALQDGIVSARTDPLLAEMREAAGALTQMGKDDRLPGRLGGRQSVITDSLQRPEAATVTYPLAVTFLVSATTESFTNHYTLIRREKGAAWQLEKAWRTDPQGRTVTEWR